MRHMRVELPRARRHAWDDVGCFALDYLPGEDRQEKRRAIVRSIKTGDLNAITQGAQLLAALLDERRHVLDDTHDRTALIAVPGHGAERPSATEPLCAELARVLPWLDHRPGTIRRHRSIRRSAGAADRPSVAEHLATLRWCGSPGPRRVIIVDDVFTHGRISSACSDVAIRTGVAQIVIAAIARTKL